MIEASERRASWRSAVLVALAVAFGAEPAARAEENVPSAAPAEATTSEATPSKDVKLGEVEIRGELEKPKIFFILPKAQRDAETRERRIRFYPDILEPLDKDRFEEEARVLYQHGIPAE